ncbi:hypothetical protein KAH27_10505, partial [bacterium]|nr:hypothetical protein [bacterium]
ILYWAGYRAARPFDIASSLDLSFASLCENSVSFGWELFPHIHPSGSTDTVKTPHLPFRFCGTRKTSVPVHVQMINNKTVGIPRKEVQTLLTHVPDGNIRIKSWKTGKSLSRLSIKTIRIIQLQRCFTVTDKNYPNIFFKSKFP